MRAAAQRSTGAIRGGAAEHRQRGDGDTREIHKPHTRLREHTTHTLVDDKCADVADARNRHSEAYMAGADRGTTHRDSDTRDQHIQHFQGAYRAPIEGCADDI